MCPKARDGKWFWMNCTKQDRFHSVQHMGKCQGSNICCNREYSMWKLANGKRDINLNLLMGPGHGFHVDIWNNCTMQSWKVYIVFPNAWHSEYLLSRNCALRSYRSMVDHYINKAMLWHPKLSGKETTNYGIQYHLGRGDAEAARETTCNLSHAGHILYLKKSLDRDILGDYLHLRL